MYSTKSYNPKAGVSGTGPGFIALGDPFKGQKPDRPSRVRGKQFLLPRTFEREKEKFPYMNDPFRGKEGYRNTQPIDDRKLGFGSHDAHRRDEFSNNLAVGIWRHSLDRDHKFMVAEQAKTGSSLEDMIAEKEREYKALCSRKRGIKTAPPAFIRDVPTDLFDIGRPGAGTTDVCFRCSRETFYCKHKVAGREHKRFGTAGDPASLDVGRQDLPQLDAGRPQHARFDQTKDFYRRGTGGTLWRHTSD